MNNCFSKAMLLALVAISACNQDPQEDVGVAFTPLTATSVIIDSGVFVNGWRTWNATPTKSTTITLDGEPSMCFTFSKWLNLSFNSTSNLSYAPIDRIEGNFYGGTYASPALNISLGTGVSVPLSNYCDHPLAMGQWSRCSVPGLALEAPRNTIYLTFVNGSGAIMPSICMNHVQVVPGIVLGTGGASTGGSPATGGQAAGGLATGGSLETGGTSTGGASTGGDQSTGGTSTGGFPETGGSATGGDQSTGGSPETGGASTGGDQSTGGVATGGSHETGGTSTGGIPSTYMPRISVGVPAFSNVGTASRINDGGFKLGYEWTISGCSATTPCWAALDIGAGPSTLLLQFSYEGGDNNFSATQSVHNYSLQVSSDSTNGSNGTWTTALDAISGQPVVVTGNNFLFRSHKITFTGQKMVKLVITSSGAPSVDELEVWDTSNNVNKAYFIQGDSITTICGQRGTSAGYAEQPSLQNLIGYTPMVTQGGTAGQGIAFGVANIDAYLAANTATKYFFLAMGTNDLEWTAVSSFKASVQTWISKVKAAGRTPILVHVIWANNNPYYGAGNEPAFNDAIDDLVDSNGLLPAVLLYEATVNHPDYFWSGDVHPNHLGCQTGWSPAFANYIHAYNLN